MEIGPTQPHCSPVPLPHPWESQAPGSGGWLKQLVLIESQWAGGKVKIHYLKTGSLAYLFNEGKTKKCV